jgi:hypothetical protein
MPPDFLLRCLNCGAEAVWDTEALPPVGRPCIGHPVLWPCAVCGEVRRHLIEDCFVVTDKLHHEICVAVEVDRSTVVLVMAELSRCRRQADPDPPEAAAAALGLSPALVEEIIAAEADWLQRRGYLLEQP